MSAKLLSNFNRSISELRKICKIWVTAQPGWKPEWANMLLIDRVHRVAKSQLLLAEEPRDVLARLYYSHFKEAIMHASRSQEGLQDRPIQLYLDLSALTLQKHREYKDIMDALRARRLSYQWGHPVHLLIHSAHPTRTRAPGRAKKARLWKRARALDDESDSDRSVENESDFMEYDSFVDDESGEDIPPTGVPPSGSSANPRANSSCQGAKCRVPGHSLEFDAARAFPEPGWTAQNGNKASAKCQLHTSQEFISKGLQHLFRGANIFRIPHSMGAAHGKKV
ncbi:Hypothetical predicted protein [Pelobates cultripes]|uniref:Uncharacterized protein n=1 Tax=Pelobates cultripes TaxID=61616 RepID=A0AAD1T1S9_PELCU|nr:Hypothetical predicted protein [Pelobates cultripes]